MSVLFRVLVSLATLACVVMLFALGVYEVAALMPGATRGMVMFAQHQKDLFLDAGLINESYHVKATSTLAQRLRDQTVIVAARSTSQSAYMGAGVILGTSAGTVEILTAKHIVNHHGRKVVIFADHAIVNASRIVKSKTQDLAIVFAPVPFLSAYPSARISAKPLQNGERFVVMGHPGAKSWTASPGVAQHHGDVTLLLCPTCERGDSGAGAFDEHGRLRGIIILKEVINAPSSQTGEWTRLTAFEAEPPAAIRVFMRSVR